MGLDNKGLGRLHRVANPRDVWASESSEFTPWLADNIDVLGAALGMALTVRATEVRVGEFRLDILAEDDAGRTVVIENQLERTDHMHLGQCLVYASGLDASTVVWVSPQFRDDFRQTLDWLNERTDYGVNFFGVEIGVVQIGSGGPRAPVFDVVARPNDWQKLAKVSQRPALDGDDPNTERQDFFGEVLTEVVAKFPGIRLPTPQRSNWVSFAGGPFGYWALSVATKDRLRIEAYLDMADTEMTKALFDEFNADKASWGTATQVDLAWERMDEKRASRIAAYHEFDISNVNRRNELREWAVATLTAMFGALNEALRDRAQAIKRQQV